MLCSVLCVKCSHFDLLFQPFVVARPNKMCIQCTLIFHNISNWKRKIVWINSNNECSLFIQCIPYFIFLQLLFSPFRFRWQSNDDQFVYIHIPIMHTNRLNVRSINTCFSWYNIFFKKKFHPNAPATKYK